MGEGTLKKILIWLIVIVIVLGVGLFGYNYYMNYKTGKFEAKKNQKEIEGIVDDINKDKDKDKDKEELVDKHEEELKSPEYYPEEKVYDIMHRMANTKIIAENDKIWGELPIDSDSLGDIRDLVSEIDYPDRNYLLEVINRWEDGDFSQADEEHNYFWTKLGGTIGKAIGVKE